MQKLKLVTLIFCFISSYSLSFGQSSRDEKNDDEYYEPMQFEKYSVGISPSAFINNFVGIQISQDFGISPRLNITLESGYIFSRLDTLPVSGFRLKPGIQYMLIDDENFGLALGMNYIYRNTTTERRYRANFREFNFVEYKYIDRKRVLQGGEFMISTFYKIADRFRLEFALGVGVGNLKLTNKEPVPDGFRQDFNELFWESQGEYSIPVLSMNINIAYDVFQWN